MENSQQSHTFLVEDRRADALGNLKSLPDELICTILDYVTPRDIARLACVSSFCVMYIFCNEEPLWMSLCLKKVNRPLQYKGSWKKTVLHLENLPNEFKEYCRKPFQFGYSVCDQGPFRVFGFYMECLFGFYYDRRVIFGCAAYVLAKKICATRILNQNTGVSSQPILF